MGYRPSPTRSGKTVRSQKRLKKPSTISGAVQHHVATKAPVREVITAWRHDLDNVLNR
jgi:hypothetical protein